MLGHTLNSFVLFSDPTIQMGWGLQAVSAVDVVLQVQCEPGAAEKLCQSVFCDGSLLHNHHSVLISKLVRTDNQFLLVLPTTSYKTGNINPSVQGSRWEELASKIRFKDGQHGKL